MFKNSIESNDRRPKRYNFERAYPSFEWWGFFTVNGVCKRCLHIPGDEKELFSFSDKARESDGRNPKKVVDIRPIDLQQTYLQLSL